MYATITLGYKCNKIYDCQSNYTAPFLKNIKNQHKEQGKFRNNLCTIFVSLMHSISEKMGHRICFLTFSPPIFTSSVTFSMKTFSFFP